MAKGLFSGLASFFVGLGLGKPVSLTGRHSRGNIGAYSRGRTQAKYGPGGRGVPTRVQLAGRRQTAFAPKPNWWGASAPKVRKGIGYR